MASALDPVARPRWHAPYFTAQGLLTRLPCPDGPAPTPRVFGASCAWFPLVGVVVGLVTAGAAALLGGALDEPKGLAAAVAVGVGALVTGSFHEDAFADVCDAFGGMTHERRREIIPFLERLHRDLDIPILYVSHAHDEVMRLADHLVLMQQGRALASGPLSEISARLDLPMAHDEDASVVIDTTQRSARALTDKLRGLFGTDNAFTLALFSFGFKHGAPRDADLVLDVRGLPNPYWDEKLRPLSGFDQAVREYVFTPEASAFYHVLKGFIRSSLELAQKAGRTSYTVAIGCTGGRHRSVSVVEALASDLAGAVSVAVEHRDVERGEGGG